MSFVDTAMKSQVLTNRTHMHTHTHTVKHAAALSVKDIL